MRYIRLLLLFSCCLLSADDLTVDQEDVVPPPGTPQMQSQTAPDAPPPTPAELYNELIQAEQEFALAESIFNPWYTGPLITPSASLVPPGHFYIQPYLFFTTNYGVYNKHGGLIHTPHLFQINPAIAPFQTGLTEWIDLSITVQALYNSINDPCILDKTIDYFYLADTGVTLGFGVLKETKDLPAIKLAVKETFPTGKYQHFSAEKAAVQSTGGGAFATTFSFNISRLLWWFIQHPMKVRASFQYTIPMHVHVEGINSYGGDFTTHGIVYGGRNFQVDLGYEYSFTQKWVGAFDFVYNWVSARHFCGATIAPVGGPFNDQISLAPAIEYNWSGSFGFIGGVWFSVWGRNSSAFHSEIISVAYYF